MGIARIVGTVAALCGASAAWAQPTGAGPIELTTATGRCELLNFAGRDFTEGCVGRLAQSVHADGRMDFTFTVGDLAVFTFSTPAAGFAQGQGGFRSIDRTVFTLLATGAPPNMLPAQGSCVYGDFAAGPALVSCTGHSSQGDFTARFTTDGAPPRPRPPAP